MKYFPHPSTGGRLRRNANSRKPLFETLEDRQLLTTYTGTGGAIVDNTTKDFTLNIADSVQIADVDVQLNIQHSRDADLDVFLVAPDGTRVELFTDVGRNGDNFTGTILDDEAGTAITSGSAPFAGSFRPEGSLADFDGKDAAGTWTLEIDDDRRRRSGQLLDWSVTIESAGPPTISISDSTVTEGKDALRVLGTFVSEDSGGLSRPRNLIFGPDGNLYVGSVDTGEILRYDGQTGVFLDAFVPGGGALQEPGGLQFSPLDGHLYVADVATNQIHRFEGQTGGYIDSPVNGLARPLGITFTSNGSLLIANQDSDEVLLYDGSTLNSFISAGSGGLDEPRNAVFGPDGLLYVSSQRTQEILRYDGTTGAFLDVFATTNLGIISPNWIEFGTDGILYASSRTIDVCCDRSFIRINAATGDVIDTFHGGQDGWSFTIGPDNLIYNAGNGFGNVVTRVGAESIATFTVSLSTASATTVTVDYTTSDGSATAGSDYAQTGGTIVFEAGETSRTILVPTIDDELTEDPATFVVNLSNPSGATLADGQGEATILDDDTLVTISISDTTVTEGDTTTVFLDEFVKADDGGVDGPRAVVLGPDGHLYVSSSFTDEVLRYDGNTGQFIDVFVTADSDVLDKPIPLLFGPDGNLYVGGNLSDNVLRFDGDTGELIDEFVSSGSGGLKFPKGMVFGPDGDLYVSSADGHGQNTPFDEVLRYSGTSGEFIDVFVTDASGGLDNPNGVAFGPDGHFYVANTTGDSINRYDGTTGEFLDVLVAAGTGGLDTPTFMEFRADGNLYVAGQATDAILVFDATSGAMVNSISGGGLDGTGGFAFDPDGDLFVASKNTNNILRFGPASTASLTVSLSSSSAEPVTVDFDTGDGTALAATDYAATSGTLVFEPGVTTQTITVPTINDAMEESTESFFVNLIAASGATIQDSQAQVTILDDDAPANPNTMYVYDIRFDSKRGGKDWRAVFEIRTDSNANGLGDSEDIAASGVQIEVEFAGQTYTGTTDTNGIFRSGWIRKLGSGDHYANAVDLLLAGFAWNPLELDLEDDSDGDGKPDEILTI